MKEIISLNKQRITENKKNNLDKLSKSKLRNT